MAKYDQKLINELPKFMENFATMMRMMRVRDGLNQGDMADQLQISRMSCRNYENNLTAQEEGISLALIMRVADHEGLSLHQLIDVLSGSSKGPKKKQKIEQWKSDVLEELASLPRKERTKFLNFITHEEEESLESEYYHNKINWAVSIINLLVGLPIEKSMEFERNLIESSLQIEFDTKARKDLLGRLDKVVSSYYDNCIKPNKLARPMKGKADLVSHDNPT